VREKEQLIYVAVIVWLFSHSLCFFRDAC